MKFTVLLIGAFALSGCGAIGSLSSGASSPFSGGGLRGSGSQIDGVRFRTRLQSSKENRRNFTAVTRSAGRNLAAATEAGRVEAVEYCLRRFGGSEIRWSQGPDRPIEQIAIGENGELVLVGTCVTR